MFSADGAKHADGALAILAQPRPWEARATLPAWAEDPARRSAAETSIALAPAVRV